MNVEFVNLSPSQKIVNPFITFKNFGRSRITAIDNLSDPSNVVPSYFPSTQYLSLRWNRNMPTRPVTFNFNFSMSCLITQVLPDPAAPTIKYVLILNVYKFRF